MERINSWIPHEIFSELQTEGFKSAHLANNTMSTVHSSTKLGQRKQFWLNINISKRHYLIWQHASFFTKISRDAGSAGLAVIPIRRESGSKRFSSVYCSQCWGFSHISGRCLKCFPSSRKLTSILTNILFTARRSFYKLARLATVVRKSNVPRYELYFRNSNLRIVAMVYCNQLE
jgi:hypothetical protein